MLFNFIDFNRYSTTEIFSICKFAYILSTNFALMEQSSPIKRNEHIVSLSREHHFSLLFGWKIKTGIKKGIDLHRIRKYALYFGEHNLTQHFKQEEATLFNIHNDELVNKALEEHTIIQNVVIQLSESNSEEDILKHLEQLAELVTDHVRFEERDLFPHLENILTEEQLKNIGHHLHEMQPEPLQDEYDDEFWMPEK